MITTYNLDSAGGSGKLTETDLTREAVFLDNYSKMRVTLAARVFSKRKPVYKFIERHIRGNSTASIGTFAAPI